MDPTILLFIRLHSDDGSFAEIVSVSRFFLQFLVNFQQITFCSTNAERFESKIKRLKIL